MESTDNKTPPRPASGRPSLLNTASAPSPDKNSQTRMLSSLEREGKIPGSVSPARQPSRKKYGVAALAVVLVAGAGAFLAFGQSDDAPPAVAATLPARVVAATVEQHPASATVAVAAASAASAASGASAQIELAAASANGAASAPLVALAPAAPASLPLVNPLDKLAQKDAEPASAPAHATVAAAVPPAHEKTHATAPKPQVLASAKPAAPHADAKAAAPHKGRKTDEDADTELVAALIARLDKRGARPAPPAPAPVATSEGDRASIAGLVRQCSTNGDLVEARQCRNRVCDGHWGKVDACPASRAPKTSRNEGVDAAWRG